MLDSTDTTLTISTLPRHPHSLSHKEMSEVFGGCGYDGDRCEDEKDCCARYYCSDQGRCE